MMNVTSMIKTFSLRLCISALLLFCSGSVMAATLLSTVDRTQISRNETLSLKISYDQQVDSSVLDLSALEQDFEVLGVSPQTNTSVSFVNGQSARQESTTWDITLVAKRNGQLNIPVFNINGDRSQAITVTVADAGQAGPSDLPLAVRVNVSAKEVAPLQQLLIDVELSAAAGVGSLNGSPLVIENADLEGLGQQSFQRVENGVARQVVVIKYAAFAKQAGELAIPAMTFTAVKGGRRGFFGNRGQQVVARSEPLTIKVSPAPQSADAWFPAEAVNIRVDWSSDPEQLQVGEPVTRTITVTAQGQRASVIPPLPPLNSSSQYKSYTDQAQLDNASSETGFVGTRIESEAIVPSIAGEVTLSDIKIPWWNVKTKRWEQAVLPAQTMTASGAAPASSDQAYTPTINNETNGDFNQGNVISGTQVGQNPKLLWGLFAAVALLSLICLVQCWWIIKLRRSGDTSLTQAQQSATESEAQAWKALQNSFKKSDPVAVRRSLLNWGRSITNNPSMHSLRSIAALSDGQELRLQIEQLDAHLYQGVDYTDLSSLSKSLDELRKQLRVKSKPTASSTLQPLYS